MSQYKNGFHVGLATTDKPVPSLGNVVSTISAIERYVKEQGSEWEDGFWNGVKEQPAYFKMLEKVGA